MSVVCRNIKCQHLFILCLGCSAVFQIHPASVLYTANLNKAVVGGADISLSQICADDTGAFLSQKLWNRNAKII